MRDFTAPRKVHFHHDQQGATYGKAWGKAIPFANTLCKLNSKRELIMKAEVYIPENRTGWWGGPDKRLRCRTCDKVVFTTEQDAEAAAAKATARGEPMIHYRGRCGHLHVARKRVRRG